MKKQKVIKSNRKFLEQIVNTPKINDSLFVIVGQKYNNNNNNNLC